MPTERVLLALEQVLTPRQPAPGPTSSRRPRQPVHQRRLLRPHRPSGGRAQFQPSRKPYDNAQAESCSRFKIEGLEARDWPVFVDLADAQASVTDYFDCYSYERRHSSIGCLKPYSFPQQQLNNST